jgi:hypothetical protein
MSIIFVKPRHDYGSMQDYWRLVELAGYRWCFEDQVNCYDPEACYILTWFNTQDPFPDDTRARLICWNLEWADTPLFENVEYWSADKWYADTHGWKYVPVGSDKRLTDDYPYGEAPLLYDITLQMYRDPARRAHALKRLRDCGLTIAPDGWGEARHQALLQSRCQVHIHQLEGAHAVSPLRFAVAAAYALPMITERLNDAGVFQRCVIQSTYDGLPDCVTEKLRPIRQAELLDFGAALYERLCVELPFKKVIEASV